MSRYINTKLTMYIDSFFEAICKKYSNICPLAMSGQNCFNSIWHAKVGSPIPEQGPIPEQS
jgi:hypothetical protein